MIRDTVKTTRGRVVYDRKKHEFKLEDILRIMKKKNAELATISVMAADWEETISCITTIPRGGSGTEPNIPGFDFAGGAFGGAGGSREFDVSPLNTADYVILIKK